ncbi:hypothetical protein VB711_07495 [Cronbergia sp. UHCC 0137]|uniref:hypothetical protein n=1 Tax=Cronbergia sp. UHCC 0137 TaxID=3110239 RepID=UPI002B1EA7B1|nr:hypothetical protein [Cronbergia sp. UHCC 0137]MEA5617679.1 hypothetical protein [Cronbergia sp. UHCC 0137]
MNVKLQSEKDNLQVKPDLKIDKESEKEEILCSHCQRTATNGIKCKGICVADNNY